MPTTPSATLEKSLRPGCAGIGIAVYSGQVMEWLALAEICAVAPVLLRLFGKITLLLALNAALGLAALHIHDARLRYARWETDSILLTMPRNTAFGAAFLGSSHAYLFSRFQRNLEITKETLGTNTFNMAMPTGGGLRPAFFYLEEFFAQGNRADQVVYFLDPFVFYTTGSNDAHKFVYFEPLRWSFLRRMVEYGYPRGRILTYIQSKFGYAWWFQRPERLYEHPGTLAGQSIDPQKVKARFDSLYVDGLRQENFNRYAQDFLRIAECCRINHARFRVVIPPTLLRAEPGAAHMLEWLREHQAEGGYDVHNLVDSMPNPEWFYNLDHLNTRGVARFMQEFLKPILASPAHGAQFPGKR